MLLYMYIIYIYIYYIYIYIYTYASRPRPSLPAELSLCKMAVSGRLDDDHLRAARSISTIRIR